MDDPLKDWGYTGDYVCRDCEQEFAVLNPGGEDPNFCPFCGSRNFTNRQSEDEKK